MAMVIAAILSRTLSMAGVMLQPGKRESAVPSVCLDLSGDVAHPLTSVM
jgi:hypothetical protein